MSEFVFVQPKISVILVSIFIFSTLFLHWFVVGSFDLLNFNYILNLIHVIYLISIVSYYVRIKQFVSYWDTTGATSFWIFFTVCVY